MRQAVIKVKQDEIERYYYDAEILETLEKTEDELSWILVHEWLRTYQDNADVIRLANAYLHSEEFIKNEYKEVRKRAGTIKFCSKHDKKSSF